MTAVVCEALMWPPKTRASCGGTLCAFVWRAHKKPQHFRGGQLNGNEHRTSFWVSRREHAEGLSLNNQA